MDETILPELRAQRVAVCPLPLIGEVSPLRAVIPTIGEGVEILPDAPGRTHLDGSQGICCGN